MASPQSASAGHYRLGEPQLQEGCSGLECTVSELLSTDLALLAAVLFAAIALVALTYLTSARSECDDERSRVKAEKKAFEQFVRGVHNLQTASVQPDVASGGGVVTQTVRQSSEFDDVYDLYENTVMSVSHYEDDYDESLRENMAIELGEDVTTALETSTRLTPQIKQALMQKGIDTKRSREAFLDTLETESDSLRESQSALSSIDRRVRRIGQDQRLQQSFDELKHYWWELDTLEDECEAVLARRQEQVRSGASASHWRGDGHGLCAYLYEDLPVRYPVLAEGALLYDRLRTTKRKFTESLTRRV